MATKQIEKKELTKIVIYGLGYIGRMVFDAIAQQKFFYNHTLKVVGAVDISEDSCAWARSQGVVARQSFAELLKEVHPDVVIHTTASSMKTVVAQLQEIIAAKIPVVSSTEELFFPWQQHPEMARDLDKLCQDNGVAMLGTGVNPGFIMDVFPALLTQVCSSIEQIKITRIVNAATRRPPLQRKIGIGLDEPSFRVSVNNGRVRPVGLIESVDFLASHVGWRLTGKEEKVDPILATKALKTGTVSVRQGDVCGFRHQAWGEVDGKRVIDLDLRIYLDAERPGDHIVIKAQSPLNVWVEGGTPGDPATVSSLIRGIPIVLRARAGIVRRLERDHF